MNRMTTRLVLAGLMSTGLASMAAGQNLVITPDGLNAGNGVFAYTPAAGVLNPATTGSLTSGAGTNYTLSSTTNGSNDHAWRSGWFFRIAGGNQELAFPNAASGSAAGVSVTRTDVSGGPAGTQGGASVYYNVTQGAAGSANVQTFVSQQLFSIVPTALGVDVSITNVLTNTGTNPVTVNLFWCSDIDVTTGFGDDVASVFNNAIFMSNANGSGQTVVAGLGNSNAYIVRGGVGGIAATTVWDEMVGGIVSNFDSTNLSSPGGSDVTYGLQWTVTLQPGQDFTAFTSLSIIPTPGAACVLGLGVLAAGRRRR